MLLSQIKKYEKLLIYIRSSFGYIAKKKKQNCIYNLKY